MNCFVFTFENRNLHDVTNKCLSDIFTGVESKFDLELISKDKTVIGAHTMVMALFSEFIHEYLDEFKEDKNQICIPLPEFSSFVLRHVVDLVYNGQIMVAPEVKPRIEVALDKLKIKGVVVTSPSDQPTSTNVTPAAAATTTTTAKPMMMPPAKQPTAPMVKRPATNLTAAKNVSASVPNLQKIPSGPAYKRQLSSNSIQCANNMQPAKRQRPQPTVTSNGLGGLPSEMQKRLGALGLKVTSSSKGMQPMQQMNQYGHGTEYEPLT